MSAHDTLDQSSAAYSPDPEKPIHTIRTLYVSLYRSLHGGGVTGYGAEKSGASAAEHSDLTG